jgi:hypothetical protein
LKALTDYFEVLHKSISLSDVVMKTIAMFAVNGLEEVRFKWFFRGHIGNILLRSRPLPITSPR